MVKGDRNSVSTFPGKFPRRRALHQLLLAGLRALLACIGAVALLHASPTHASASPRGSSGSGTLLGTQIGANVRYGSPPRDASECHWRHVVDVDSLTGVYGPISRMMGDTVYSLFERSCPGPPPVSHQFWVRDDAHTALATRASRRVVASLPQPIFGTAPSPLQMVVNVGTWFWIADEVWKPVSVTAYLPTPEGIVWVTTTATPTRTVFSAGDASRRTVTCVGPGRQWKPQFGDRATSPCMYTYTHATTSRPNYSARIGIEWQVSWESNLGASGTLPSVRTTFPISVRVREIQALTTN